MQVIDINSKLYPKKLKEIRDAPKILYVEGNTENLNTNCISIVGSRKCTQYGKKWCEIFAKELVQYDLTIVSGMAIGIDTIAHSSAIKVGGRTIAVLPSGLKNIYPKENENLYKKIASTGGTIISEYNINEKANSKRFLERNRIVSGMSLGTLVVEAAYRSGTSVTAGLAKSQNRDVFCIPGSLDNLKSVGTNTLIKEFAELVTCPDDIICKYDFLKKIKLVKSEEKDKTENVTDEYKEIYELITDKPIDIDTIIRACNMNFQDIVSKLTILELEGKIKKIAGNRYIREVQDV